jgi:hypothetical protein
MHEAAPDPHRGGQGSSSEASGVRSQVRPALVSVPLSPQFHRVGEYRSGRAPRIEEYLKRECLRQIQEGYTRLFVLPDPSDQARVLGYYTLSAAHMEKEHLSHLSSRQVRKALPVPAPMALIGRLGRCDSAPKGFGAVVLADAHSRSLAIQDLGIWGVMLHAANSDLVSWYRRFGYHIAKPGLGPAMRTTLMYAPRDSLAVGD